MPNFTITGNTPLYGSVRVGGAKNASYKLMIAALLAENPSRILNFSHISDVGLVAKLINDIGGHAAEAGERCYHIDPRGISQPIIDRSHGEASRASTLFLPVFLHRFKKATVPEPGGDKIGKRPLERHFEGLQKLGVKIVQHDGLIECSTDGLVGCDYSFAKNTHTGTETLLLAAVCAKGRTTLRNCALETEIDDLIAFLNAMGGKIHREPDRVIIIDGVKTLSGAIHKIMPDQNQVVSFACAALVTKGDIVVENARRLELESFFQSLDAIGAGYEVGTYGVRFFYKGPMHACDIETAIHPGFKTDWQPLWVTVLTQVAGVSTVHETISQNRFQYVPSLVAMGASIELYNPVVANPDAVYNFNWSDRKESDLHAARIVGPCELKGGSFDVVDLRHGATLMIAGMAAQGQTILRDPHSHIDRGYEHLDEQLNAMGATIVRSS